MVFVLFMAFCFQKIHITAHFSLLYCHSIWEKSAFLCCLLQWKYTSAFLCHIKSKAAKHWFYSQSQYAPKIQSNGPFAISPSAAGVWGIGSASKLFGYIASYQITPIFYWKSYIYKSIAFFMAIYLISFLFHGTQHFPSSPFSLPILFCCKIIFHKNPLQIWYWFPFLRQYFNLLYLIFILKCFFHFLALFCTKKDIPQL